MAAFTSLFELFERLAPKVEKALEREEAFVLHAVEDAAGKATTSFEVRGPGAKLLRLLKSTKEERRQMLQKAIEHGEKTGEWINPFEVHPDAWSQLEGILPGLQKSMTDAFGLEHTVSEATGGKIRVPFGEKEGHQLFMEFDHDVAKQMTQTRRGKGSEKVIDSLEYLSDEFEATAARLKKTIAGKKGPPELNLGVLKKAVGGIERAIGGMRGLNQQGKLAVRELVGKVQNAGSAEEVFKLVEEFKGSSLITAEQGERIDLLFEQVVSHTNLGTSSAGAGSFVDRVTGRSARIGNFANDGVHRVNNAAVDAAAIGRHMEEAGKKVGGFINKLSRKVNYIVGQMNGIGSRLRSPQTAEAALGEARTMLGAIKGSDGQITAEAFHEMTKGLKGLEDLTVAEVEKVFAGGAEPAVAKRVYRAADKVMNDTSQKVRDIYNAASGHLGDLSSITKEEAQFTREALTMFDHLGTTVRQPRMFWRNAPVSPPEQLTMFHNVHSTLSYKADPHAWTLAQAPHERGEQVGRAVLGKYTQGAAERTGAAAALG